MEFDSVIKYLQQRDLQYYIVRRHLAVHAISSTINLGTLLTGTVLYSNVDTGTVMSYVIYSIQYIIYYKSFYQYKCLQCISLGTDQSF